MLVTPLAAHRADDAFLAQPFRVGPAEGAHHAPHVPPERHAARERARQLRRRCCTRSPRIRRCSSISTASQNRKGAPNENFAREVMELFTLGEGHYTEQDVKEAARAFTGWSVDRETGRYVFRPRLHDDGVEDGARKERPLRRRRSARHPARAAGDRGVHRDREALARVRLARRRRRAKCGGSRARFRESQLRHPGRARRDPDERRVLCAARIAACSSSRRSSSSSARCASVRSEPGRDAAVRGRRGRHGPEPVLAAQRQGLAGRRGVDQHDDAARAQAVLDRVLRADELQRSPQRCADGVRADAGGNAMRAKTIAAPIGKRRTADASDAVARRSASCSGWSAASASVALRQRRDGWRSFPARRRSSARAARAATAARRSTPQQRRRSRRRAARARARARARRGLSAEVTRSRRWTAAASCGSSLAMPPALAAFGGPAASACVCRARRRAPLPQPARADRAQGRQRRPQHARAVSRIPRTTRCARSSRSRATRSCSSRDRAGLHPSLAPLLPLWKERRARGPAGRRLSGAQPFAFPLDRDLGHRIGERRVPAGRLADAHVRRRRRRRARLPPTASSSARNDLGPLAGGGTRAVALANTDQFLRQARLASPDGQPRATRRSQHILKVEADIVQAATHLDARTRSGPNFRRARFGNAIRTACQVIANPGRRRGRARHAGRLRHAQRAGRPRRRGCSANWRSGVVALRSALTELDRWDDTLVLTYAEFGRRPKENLSNGTDHGTASVHFALGGRVAGGFYGEQPSLDRLGGDGNTGYALDFRSVYATVLERWWGMPSTRGRSAASSRRCRSSRPERFGRCARAGIRQPQRSRPTRR